MDVRITSQGLEVTLSESETLSSLDVLFGERRIWSLTVRTGASGFHPWPEVLADRLFGRSNVTVKDSSTGAVYAARRVKFDDVAREFRLLDAAGRPLMVNKWHRLAPMLADGAGNDKRDQLVEILTSVRSSLEQLGHSVFAVGGTALGPFRDGDLFEFDDDGDLAVLLEQTEPVDVSLQMMQIHRDLEASEYRVRVHSHAHLQVYAPTLDVDSALYVDVFAAFFSNGVVNQPFHLRGPMEKEQLIPFSQITIRGEEFPIARDAEHWFTLNYGADWRIPQPGYSLSTPPDTKRRFYNWFGSFNLHRHFWERWVSSGSHEQDYRRLIPRPPAQTLSSQTILNVGSGPVASLPTDLHCTAAEVSVFALDFADEARAAAVTHEVLSDTQNVTVQNVNFGNYHEVVTFVAGLPSGAFDIYAGFAIEGQDRIKRVRSFWRFARMSLLSGGKVVIDHLDTLGPGYAFDDPRTWHLSLERVQAELRDHGLEATRRGSGHVMVAGARRSYTRTEVTLESHTVA